ncbi:MAG: ABC transporter ATP-binding protein/permease [Clostridia bacterium]|nr:ABC transporter ATP-binding protein/permease [Clostridia bacterium]
MLRKIIKKLREGALRDMIAETKWIYHYAARYRSAIAIYLVIGLSATALGLGSSVASKYLIDAVIGRDDNSIIPAAVFYIVMGLVRIGANALTRRVSGKISVQASNEIRADVFARFLDVDWQASLDYHSGDLLTRVNSDVATVSESILGWIPSLITGLVQFFGTLAVILYYDPTMAVIALLGAPVTVLLSRFLLSRLRSFSVPVRERQAELTGFSEASLQNLQAIKSFHLEGQFRSKLDFLQKLYRDVALDYNLFSVGTGLLLSSTGFAVSVLCFAWGAYRLWGGFISYGTMLLFIQLAGLVSSSFSSLVHLIPSAVSATVAAGRITAILSLPHEDESLSIDTREVLAHAEDGVSVALDHVAFQYKNGRPVFTDVSLTAAPGEIIGVVSPSGGGKTTLIRTLLGLIAPDEGQVTFSAGGHTASIVPPLRTLVTYVAQEKVVFSGTVADSLRLSSPLATDDELWKALEAACAKDFIEVLPQKLETPIGERGSGFSEGQLQRLSIARAILSDAPVMLLDEATSALDLATEKQVLSNVLSDPRRRTVIVTTHRPTVLRSCTRVYSLEKGKAVLLDEEKIRVLAEAR